MSADLSPDDARPTSLREKLVERFRELLFRFKGSHQAFMISVAVLLGILGGAGAIGFRWGIDLVQRLSWPGEGTGHGTIELVRAAPLWMRVVVPTVGGIVVGWIIRLFAREAKGHGVPEVMEAIAVRGGVIRPRVVAAKLAASAVTIGTGGSAGREGPIIQIGSAIGSMVGTLLRVSSARLKTFVACGAAAGMAATFNAPIAGALFAGEVILGNFGAALFGPIVISSVVGTAMARSFLGNEQVFPLPVQYTFESPYELIPYAVLGVFATLIGLLFVSVLHRSELFFEKLRVPDWTKPGIGGLLLGLSALALPEMMGVGYDLMNHALLGETGLGLVVMFLFLKMIGTSITLGSGGSGGVFAPSLLFGAMTGAAVGHLAGMVLPETLVAEPGAYALVGMGAMVAATTHAPITAIVVLFELTGKYEIILPLMIACTISTLLAMRLRRDSIYTIRLSDRGRKIRFGREVNVLRSMDVGHVVRKEPVQMVSEGTPLPELIQLMVHSPEAYFYVRNREEHLCGVVSVHDLRKVLDMQDVGSLLVAADVARTRVIRVKEDDTLDVAMHHFGQEQLEELPVVAADDPHRVVGTLHRRDVVNAYNREMFKRDMAGELAVDMTQVGSAQMVEVAEGFGLLEIEAPAEFVGRTLAEIGFRQKHDLEILLIQRKDGQGPPEAIMPSAKTVIVGDDKLLLFGKSEALRPFREFY